MIAMALAVDPKLLIADEPTTALDVTVQAEIVRLVQSIQRERGMAMVWVTHDLALLARLADRVVVMYAGRIVEDAAGRSALCAAQPPLYGRTAGQHVAHRRSVHRAGADRGVRRPIRRSSVPGCSFAPRCSRALPRCRRRVPELSDMDDGRRVACFNPHGTPVMTAAPIIRRKGSTVEFGGRRRCSDAAAGSCRSRR